MSRPFVVGVGGFTSNVGKTTLMCELLRAFPGWEAIKTTRGHYRSCGKDPHACCVSHLLSEEPVIRSGREGTYEAGKDTGRYWDAGAANVHWLIATDEQIEKGIKEALSHVVSKGVFIEGNSFSQFIRPDYFVMVRRSSLEQIKKSAKAALQRASAVYVSDDDSNFGASDYSKVFSASSLPLLFSDLRNITTNTI
jgi:molybdopterin-guanine dinucleotide biosynthesis protein